MSNVEWLLRGKTGEHVLRLGDRIDMDNAKWRGTIERILIGPGLRLFLTDTEARQDVKMEPRGERAGQWVSSQVTIAGRAEIDFLDGQRIQLTADQAVLFRAPTGRAAYSAEAGSKFHSVGFSLDIARIERLFDGEVPEMLQALLEPDADTCRIVPVRADRTMRTVARSLFGNELNGPLRTLMMEGAAIQLLALQAAAAQQQPRSRDKRELSARERDAVHEARRRLLADMGQPPTLGELAFGAGLSEKRLNEGFRQLFGATVFDVLRNERLAHARNVLLAEQASLKDVAFRVGYNHVSNFITAFTARYGAPPRQYMGED